MPYNLLISAESELEQNYIGDIINSYFDNVNIINFNIGENLISYAQDNELDLIMIEVDNSRSDGLMSIKELKKNDATNKIPIVAISSPELFQEAFDLGAIDFICKPYDKINIITRVKSTLFLLDSFKEITKREKEISKRNIKIEQQQEDQTYQEEVIKKINDEILADLRYSRKIQLAVLPNKSKLDWHLKDYFVINKPKSIVSGDFHWISMIDESIIIAVGDCTGHGVSGALMHMMATIFLNDIIQKGSFENAGDILDQLREYIMAFLNQTGKQGETQDGLDISLCMIDQDNYNFQFAGANNSAYLIRGDELIEFKGDRMPVGIHINFDKPFNTQYSQLQSDDSLYLFTDGYADQFGGPNGKKFRYKHFKEHLLENQNIPMAQQGSMLSKIHDEWKGDLEQIDDIMIVGMKIL